MPGDWPPSSCFMPHSIPFEIPVVVLALGARVGGWDGKASGLTGEGVRGALEVIVAALYMKGRPSVFLSPRAHSESSTFLS